MDSSKSANPQPPTQWQLRTPTPHFDERMKPATQKAGTAELLACLTLVAPSGMTAEDRNAWVQVARETLRGIPADLLQRGCRKARETCRFASEVVPAIVSETRVEWARRKRVEAERQALFENRNSPRLAKPEYVSADQVRKLVEQLAKSG